MFVRVCKCQYTPSNCLVGVLSFQLPVLLPMFLVTWAGLRSAVVGTATAAGVLMTFGFKSHDDDDDDDDDVVLAGVRYSLLV